MQPRDVTQLRPGSTSHWFSYLSRGASLSFLTRLGRSDTSLIIRVDFSVQTLRLYWRRESE